MPRLVLSICIGLCAGCDGGGDRFASGACGSFGVTEPVPVPATCSLEVQGDGESVRVFAIGAVIRYRELLTYADFCRAWDDVVRTEVLPCLATEKPNFLVFPENASLAGAFIGSRGAPGRATTDTMTGFLSFFETYEAPVEFYSNRYPEVSINGRLVLALTDTLHRAFQTFPQIAKAYGVHVAVSSDFAPAEGTTDAATVATLRDPDLDAVDTVWVASEPKAFNWGILFGPDGVETDRIAKTYLVPDEEDLLDLTHEELLNVRPLQSPFARIGMVISKDAWMPDVLHRLELLGANLMLQPEAFAGWAIEEFEGDWLPDIVRQSAWGHTQRHQLFRHNVTPCIKGNLLGLVFDCQSHITQASGPADRERAFIGHDPYAGLLALEPWVIEDPGPPSSLEERRAVLRDRGERMLPDSGDPLEDAYEGHVIAADLTFAENDRIEPTGDGSVGAFGPSVVLDDPSEATHHQRFAAIAADGDTVLVAFMEGPVTDERVRLLRSDNGGASFSDVALPASTTTQRAPRVAARGDRAIVAWEEDTSTGAEVVTAVTVDGESWSTSRVTDVETGAGWQPAVAINDAGAFIVAWLDFRAEGHPKPWVARSAGGDSWSESQVDPANDIVDNPRGNAAFVDVVAGEGKVHVAFADFREFSWDVYLGTSTDGGDTFAPAVRINAPAATIVRVFDQAEVEAERIHGDVALAIDAVGEPLVAWTERQDRRYEGRIAFYDGSETHRADDAPQGVDAWRPDIAVSATGDPIVVWQDLRSTTNGIQLRALGEEPGPSETIDDAAAEGHAYAPRVAVAGESVVVVWEDPRSGYSRIHLARQ